MIYGLATALCWTASGYGSARSARALGSGRANRWRLSIGLVALAVIHVAVSGWVWWYPGQWWFLLAGVVHLGFGDTALYGCFRLLGPRLGGLVCLCSAVPIAGLLEWLWLGTAIPLTHIILFAGIIISVWAALAPTERGRLGTKAIWQGVMCGLGGALCHGVGAVVTRYAYALTNEAQVSVHPMSGAFLRSIGALLGMLTIWLLTFWWFKRDVAATYSESTEKAQSQANRRVWPWLMLSAGMGTVIGVAAYQRAFETSPAAEVQAMVALIPLCMVPVAWIMDGDKPSLRSVLAGMGAVGCVITLAAIKG